MKPLTTTDLIKKAAFHEQVFFRWFWPEVEGRPDTAWQTRTQGFEVVRVQRRPKNRRHATKHFFVIGERFTFDDNTPIEEGYEIDGHGHVYFFDSPEHADAFVKMRQERFAAESRSLLGAVAQNLRGTGIHFDTR